MELKLDRHNIKIEQHPTAHPRPISWLLIAVQTFHRELPLGHGGFLKTFVGEMRVHLLIRYVIYPIPEQINLLEFVKEILASVKRYRDQKLFF